MPASFGVVGEVGREDVAHVGWVAGDEVTEVGETPTELEVVANCGQESVVLSWKLLMWASMAMRCPKTSHSIGSIGFVFLDLRW
jgi:hypothetical protein